MGRAPHGLAALWVLPMAESGVSPGGPITTCRGRTAVDANFRVLCPGFIDTHSHADLVVFVDSSLAPRTWQGVTTEVMGQDAFSLPPIYREDGAEEWPEHLSGLAGRPDIDWSGGGEHRRPLRRGGGGWHSAERGDAGRTLNGPVRGPRGGRPRPDGDELERMADLVTDGLDDGALGFTA